MDCWRPLFHIRASWGGAGLCDVRGMVGSPTGPEGWTIVGATDICCVIP